MSALIDGLWIRLGIGDPTVTSSIAISLARDLSTNALPAVAIPGETKNG